MRVGFGFDIHPLRDGRSLVLGGLDVPYEKGLFGHSDADVLLHAICDALLGSIAAGDIGRHFPDTEPQYNGINSLELLSRVGDILKKRNTSIVNIDSTIVCELPRLQPYMSGMVKNIASALCIDEDRVSVKATRGEGLGFAGRGEGLAAYAVASVELLKNREVNVR